jgi:hypothetical protein
LANSGVSLPPQPYGTFDGPMNGSRPDVTLLHAAKRK